MSDLVGVDQNNGWGWRELPHIKILDYQKVELPEGEARRMMEHDVFLPSEETEGFGAKIVALPDKVGIVYLPWMYTEPNDDYLQYFRDKGLGKALEISDFQNERLRYCIKVLKLPIILAVDLTFNRPGVNLSEFKVPENGTISSLMVAITGPPGSGKSVTTALLASKLGVPAINFDPVSSWSVDKYLERLREHGLGERSKIIDMAQVLFSNRVRGEEEKGKILPLRDMLQKTDVLLKNGNRPPIIFCDMPGDNKERPRDIFDAAGHHAFALAIRTEEFDNAQDMADGVKMLVDGSPVIINWARAFQNKFADSL